MIPVAGFRAVALAAARCPRLRDPRRHRVRARSSAAAPIRGGRTAGSTRTSSPPTRGCTSSAGRTRSRRGTTRGSRAGSTASGSAGSSLPSRSSTGAPARRRRRCSGSSSCSRRQVDERLARRAVGDAASALARGGRGAAGGVPPAAGRRARASRRVRLTGDRLTRPRTPRWPASAGRRATTAGRCRS